MNTINITETQASQIAKTSWVILQYGELIQVCKNRDEARADKRCLPDSKIFKAAEVTFEVVKPAAGPLTPIVALKPAPIEKAAKPASVKIEITHESIIERPCKAVWSIADEMIAANPMVKRGQVLAECVARGIAFYTARTQFQQWLSVQKEMAEREAKNGSK